MHEVEVGAIGHARPQLRIARLGETAPSDHGDARRRADRDHSPGEEAEALMPPMLGRLIEKELVAQTYPKDGLSSPRQLDDAAAEAALLEPRQRRREGADPGKHDACGTLQVLSAGGQKWLGANLKKRAFDRADVAGAV